MGRVVGGEIGGRRMAVQVAIATANVLSQVCHEAAGGAGVRAVAQAQVIPGTRAAVVWDRWG